MKFQVTGAIFVAVGAATSPVTNAEPLLCNFPETHENIMNSLTEMFPDGSCGVVDNPVSGYLRCAASLSGGDVAELEYIFLRGEGPCDFKPHLISTALGQSCERLFLSDGKYDKYSCDGSVVTTKIQDGACLSDMYSITFISEYVQAPLTSGNDAYVLPSDFEKPCVGVLSTPPGADDSDTIKLSQGVDAGVGTPLFAPAPAPSESDFLSEVPMAPVFTITNRPTKISKKSKRVTHAPSSAPSHGPTRASKQQKAAKPVSVKPSKPPGKDCSNAFEPFGLPDGSVGKCSDVANLGLGPKRKAKCTTPYVIECPGLCGILDKTCRCHDYENSFLLRKGSFMLVTCDTITKNNCNIKRVRKNCPTKCDDKCKTVDD